MSTITLVTILILAVFIAKNTLFYAWLWQIKEYRIDRMSSYLREGGLAIRNNLPYITAFLLFLFFFTGATGEIFSYLALALSIFFLFRTIDDIRKKAIKRPDFTARIIFTFLLLAAIYSLIAFCFFTSRFPSGGQAESRALLLSLFVILVNPVIISLVVFATNPVFTFQKYRIIKKARRKMQQLKNIRTIGITGSYGKTSTKEFLYAILGQKYKVVRTEGNNNTNIGVAYTVLNKVSDDFDFFICEMGAYKIGEIAEISGIVKPEIGILTGINEQHADLFGSIENTVKAKFELIKALPEDGLAVINSGIGNKKPCLPAGKPGISAENIRYFSLSDANNLKAYPDHIEFNFRDTVFKMNVLGKHYAENVISAAIVAEFLGMNIRDIKDAAEKIMPTEYMMKRIDGSESSTFIDNTYSANPDGVLAALEYLKEAYPDCKKIIVFPGIIELGKERDKIHKMLYDKIDIVCDKAYILKAQKPKTKSQNLKCKFIFEKDFDKTANLLKKDLDDKTVVLFESRGAGVVMNKLLKK